MLCSPFEENEQIFYIFSPQANENEKDQRPWGPNYQTEVLIKASGLFTDPRKACRKTKFSVDEVRSTQESQTFSIFNAGTSEIVDQKFYHRRLTPVISSDQVLHIESTSEKKESNRFVNFSS